MPFTSILCGVEGNPASTEAARQAIALAGERRRPPVHRRLHELRTRPRLPQGHAREAASRRRPGWPAEAGVSASDADARGASTRSTSCCRKARSTTCSCSARTATRAPTGILFGSTASEAAHGTERPLLIAREAPGSEPFPKDDPRRQRRHRRLLGARSAPRPRSPPPSTPRSSVVHVEDGKHEIDQSMLDAQLAEIAETTGASRSWPSPTATRPRRSSRPPRRRAPR